MDNNSKLKIGITGGTGFLGSRLIELLLEKDVEITCLVRDSSNVTRLPENTKQVKGELSDIQTLKSFVIGKDVIVHLAAQVARTTKEKYYLSNVIGTENLCKAIMQHNNTCRLINCSSIAAYRIKGICKLQFTDYAKSKLGADKVVDQYMKVIKATTIVPGMIYGPGNNVFIPTIVENLKNNQLFFATGGEKHAPLSYIDDLCDLFLRAIYNEKSVGNKYFGIKYSEKGIHDFIRMIAAKTNCTAPDKVLSKTRLMTKAVLYQLIYSFFNIKKSPKLPIRMVDVLSINYHLSAEQRENNLGWEAKVDMEEGINNVLSTYDLNLHPKSKKMVTM
ncbi:MAG: NAD(P)-dependent oxidoreductase [Tannerellaceae bacterium]|nr:NAD(P)-dependent oxidoreductase [Tannerellaceae bacterium]